MTFAMAAGLGLAGLGVAADAQAQPGPFPQWCPGDFWDPGWATTGMGASATTTGAGMAIVVGMAIMVGLAITADPLIAAVN
jgi:hypothetical protein